MQVAILLLRVREGSKDTSILFSFARYNVCVQDGSGALKTDAESQIHRKIDKIWSILFDSSVV